jgi:peptidoglycan/LPS O-acetylase OafA/YrhL
MFLEGLKRTFYQWLVDYGYVGVTAFFVISGFALRESLRRSITVAEFVRRRFWRIYPPYIASLVLVVAVVLLRICWTGSNDLAPVPDTFTGWLATLTLTTKPVTSTPVMNWVYWSLSVEAAFYALLAMTLARPNLEWALLIAVTGLALASPEGSIFFLNWWSFFLLGLIVSDLSSHKSTMWPTVALAMCILDACLNREIQDSIVAYFVAACIFLATTKSGNWLNREPWLSRAGVWSYSLYLIHVPLGCWLYLVTLHSRIGPPAEQALSVHVLIDGVGLCFALGIAVLFHRWIEQPARAYSRRSTVVHGLTTVTRET